MDGSNIYKERLDRNSEYMLHMRPVFQPRALFSDETENYVTPMEPEPGESVTIRFRSAKNNVDSVFLISGEERISMDRYSTVGEFDFYSAEVTMDLEVFSYYFEVNVGKLKCFYNKRGVSKGLEEYYAFRIKPGFHTPDWAKGAVMYQIYVDRFCNGNPDNDVVDREYYYIGEPVSRVLDWNKKPAYMGVREFYGGDLQGVMDKLDYLQDLGVEVLYLNPLFVSPSNHKYDTQDYDYIDPHFTIIKEDGGEPLETWDNNNRNASKYIKRVTNLDNLKASNEFFAKFMEEVHGRGMKVILDGVFNHCGSFNKWMDREGLYENQEGYEKGAYVAGDSPYNSFFKFYGGEWPYNHNYDGWWGHDTLPKLAYEQSPKLTEYILRVAQKWVSPPYNVDGWRLDVAADLGFSSAYNHKFWQMFRKVVKDANPNAIILAEHYGEPVDWLQGNEWDTVMNYDAFMEPLTWFFTGMEKHSDEFREDLLGNADCFTGAMRHHRNSFMAPSWQIAMNELSNHDHSRFLTRTNHKVGRVAELGHEAAEQGINKAVMREAVVMQMTWAGAPTVYYGDEAGVCGFTDPDNRRTYPWGNEDHEMIRFHKEMIRIHKIHPVITYGSLKMLDTAYGCIAYVRFSASEQIVVLFNNNPEPKDTDYEVWYGGVPLGAQMISLIHTDESGFYTDPILYSVHEGKLHMHMNPYSAIVLRVL